METKKKAVKKTTPRKKKWQGKYTGLWAMNGNEPLDNLMYAIQNLVVLGAPVKALIESAVVSILTASKQPEYATLAARVPHLNKIRKNVIDNLDAMSIFSTSFVVRVNKGLVDGQAWEQQNRKQWDKENK